MVAEHRICAGLLLALCGGCAEDKACEAGYGLAADGKCYPIYDPENPPWRDRDDDGVAGDGGTGGGSSGADGGAGDGGALVSPEVAGTYTISAELDTGAVSAVWLAVWPEGALAGGIPDTAPPLAEGEFPVTEGGVVSDFRLVVDVVPPEGTLADVTAVLFLDDGDVTDDPAGLWLEGPAMLSPDAGISGVEITIPGGF